MEYWPHSREGTESKSGFGSVTNDLTKEGVLDALAKAKRNRVYDPDFKTLPEPVDKPALTNYHDKRVMEVSGKETVNLGWKALDGALKTLHDGGHKKTIIIGGDVTILRERMAIKTTKGIDDFDETTSLTANITAMIENKNVKGTGWSMDTHLAAFEAGSRRERSGRECNEDNWRKKN